MGLKAGWLAFFIFVWIIGAFLGSTFDYQSTEAATGVSYTTGTATFTTASDEVTSGGAAVWDTTMEEGNIRADDDGIWVKIKHVGGGYLINFSGSATGSPLTLDVGANVVTVTGLGTLRIILPAGNTGTATSGVCTVVDSPVALVAGTNTIRTTGVIGTITITTVGATVVFLYSPYTGDGGAGLDYTMRPTPGWAGTGGGGYSDAPTTTLQTLMEAKNAIQRSPIIGTFSVVTNGEFWGAVFKVVTWQWSFLQNPDGSMAYGLFYWIVLFPFIAMAMLSIILLAYGILTGNLTWG